MTNASEATAEINQIVAERMRVARILARMTQKELAQKINVSVQQVQKYEHGANRVTVGRLGLIARETGQPVSFFFNGLDGIES